MTNFQKAKNLESDYLSQIQKLIETAGSQNQLSILLYGNENTLQTKLNRAKKGSPYKLISYLKILQDCEKAFVRISPHLTDKVIVQSPELGQKNEPVKNRPSGRDCQTD